MFKFKDVFKVRYIDTYMFVVVNFDALAQASDIRIERRQVVFLCWRQDSNPSGSQTPNRQQTECPLTNRLHTYIHTYIHTCIHTYTLCMHACMHTYVRTYVRTYERTNERTYVRTNERTYARTYIFILGCALAHGTLLFEIFAWKSCDGFKSKLRDGYLFKCDSIFTVIDILFRLNEKQTCRCLSHCSISDSVNTMVLHELYLALTPNLRILRQKVIQGISQTPGHTRSPALHLCYVTPNSRGTWDWLATKKWLNSL